jgi:hypothetical protein
MPQGKRSRGRPKTTWCRTIVSELKELGITWGEAETKAKDRNGIENKTRSSSLSSSLPSEHKVTTRLRHPFLSLAFVSASPQVMPSSFSSDTNV